MKKTIIWNPVSELPIGDIYNGNVAIREVNKNYEFQKSMGLETSKYTEYVLPAVYVFNENTWMSNGLNVTNSVIYWTILEFPKPTKKS